jgi:glucose/arabinose dehydrogenase
VTVGRDGSLLVSDDDGDVIYRVSAVGAGSGHGGTN